MFLTLAYLISSITVGFRSRNTSRGEAGIHHGSRGSPSGLVSVVVLTVVLVLTVASVVWFWLSFSPWARRPERTDEMRWNGSNNFTATLNLTFLDRTKAV
ncbi:hypothetical protein ACFE04_001168 [Oxalis oulophora]